MTPTSRLDLLTPILLHPEDNTRRLIYADWLEENNDSLRSELIRVQVELARLEALPPLPRKRPGDGGYRVPRMEAIERKTAKLRLCRRERKLLEEKWIAWTIDLSLMTTWNCNNIDVGWNCRGSVLFRRGFVDRIWLTYDDWTNYGPEIVTHHPITEVVIADKIPWNAGGYRWGWTSSPNDFPGPRDWCVPHHLFRHLPPTHPALPQSPYRRWYPSQQTALDALRETALRWARLEAFGIPCEHCGGGLALLSPPEYDIRCPKCDNFGKFIPDYFPA